METTHKFNQIFLALLLFPITVTAQTLSGLWHEKSPVVGSGYGGRYYFTESTFEYRVSEYDQLNPIRTFGGTYRQEGDSITFTVTYYNILTHFGISRDVIVGTNNQWAYCFPVKDGRECADEQVVTLETPCVSDAAFRRDGEHCLWIDGDIYYKIEEVNEK